MRLLRYASSDSSTYLKYASGVLGRKPCIHIRLDLLATNPCEKCGLRGSSIPEVIGTPNQDRHSSGKIMPPRRNLSRGFNRQTDGAAAPVRRKSPEPWMGFVFQSLICAAGGFHRYLTGKSSSTTRPLFRKLLEMRMSVWLRRMPDWLILSKTPQTLAISKPSNRISGTS
jgi:hypothetical protein